MLFQSPPSENDLKALHAAKLLMWLCEKLKKPIQEEWIQVGQSL